MDAAPEADDLARIAGLIGLDVRADPSLEVQDLDLGFIDSKALGPSTPIRSSFIGASGGGVLFDTGIGEQDIQRTYKKARPIHEAMRQAGRELDDIRTIVNSHLHFDHCGGNGTISNATLLVQEREMAAASAALCGLAAEVHVVGGHAPVRDGIYVLSTPGHTPGHQSLLILGARRVLLAGDAAYTAEIFLAPDPGRVGNAVLASQVRGDMTEWVESLKFLRHIARLCDEVRFSHDRTVLDLRAT